MKNKTSPAEMDPIIWIRTSTPSRNLLELLPSMKLTDYFAKVDTDEAIEFRIEKKDLPWAEIDQYELRDPASIKLLKDI